MTSNITTTEIGKGWTRLLIDIELARNYPIPYALEMEALIRNPILESLLPGLLYIKMVSLLDEAMTTYLYENQINMPRSYRNSLQGRIDFLSDQGLLSARGELHRMRFQRNDLAHEASQRINWIGLDQDVTHAENALKELHLVENRPKYEFYAERSAMRDSEHPKAWAERDYSFGLKSEGTKVVEVSWNEKLLKDET